MNKKIAGLMVVLIAAAAAAAVAIIAAPWFMDQGEIPSSQKRDESQYLPQQLHAFYDAFKDGQLEKGTLLMLQVRNEPMHIDRIDCHRVLDHLSNYREKALKHEWTGDLEDYFIELNKLAKDGT